METAKTIVIAVFLIAFIFLCPLFSKTVEPEKVTQLDNAVVLGANTEQEYLESRFLTIPEDDSARWATLIITSEDWQNNPDERRVVDWFSTDPHLQKLQATTHSFHYTPKHQMWHERFKEPYGQDFPTVVLQRFDGKNAFKISGSRMAQTSEELVRRLDKAIQQCTPDGCRPRPRPKPDPPQRDPNKFIPDTFKIEHQWPNLGLTESAEELSGSFTTIALAAVVGLVVIALIIFND